MGTSVLLLLLLLCRHTCRIGMPSYAHLLIISLPNRHSGIAPSSHLTESKLNAALTVAFSAGLLSGCYRPR